jgi:hypothetical protein
MAETFVLVAGIGDPERVVAAQSDGVVRVRQTNPGNRHPREAIWTFVPVRGEYGIVVDQRYGKALLAAGDEVRVGAAVDESALWRIYWHTEYVALMPKAAPQKMLAKRKPNEPMRLIQGDLENEDIQAQCLFIRREIAAVPDVPHPPFTEQDDGFYTIEAVPFAGSSDADPLYLTVENELAKESAVKFGRNPKASAAQFRVLPYRPAAVRSDGKTFGTTGKDGEEQVVALPATARPIALVNLSGAYSFVHGDRVALRSHRLRYVSWKEGAHGLTVRAWTPGANETFVIRKIGGTGEIHHGDRFALLAGKDRYVSDDRGSGNKVTASAPHVSAWETFVLEQPEGSFYRLLSRTTGRALRLGGDIDAPDRPLQHRYAQDEAEPFTFSLEDYGSGLVALRGAGGTELRPSGAGGVRDGEPVGASRSAAAGTFFRFRRAAALPFPDTPDLTMESYRDPVEDYTRTIAGAAVAAGGALSGIPGGSAIFTAAFNRIFPEKKVSTYDLFSRFRADILRDVKNLIATNTVFQANGALRNAHEQYLITYLNARRAAMNGGEALTEAKSALTAVASPYITVLSFLSVECDPDGTIRDTDQNASTIRAGLPVFATCVAEYMNVLQEMALLHAYQPKLAAPDVWLRTRDQYVTATTDGVRYGATEEPLHQALRVLERNGAQTLRHGDKVILRTPASTNVTAIDGGGGALSAKTPSRHIAEWEVFTIESVDSSGAGIGSGGKIALRTHDGHYVTAPDGGGPLAATAKQRGAAETFAVEIHRPALHAEPPLASNGLPYEVPLQNLRTFADLRYKDVRDYFLFLVGERTSGKHVYPDQEHWTISYSKLAQRFEEDRWSLSFRDNVYRFELDRVAPDSQQKPPGWDDFDNYDVLQTAMDQYRQGLRTTAYYYKYRHFDALRPLLTIADDTRRLCEEMWNDPLAATEYAYAARTTPEYKG